ncbi:sodium-dependent bicarbonate transport family permease [Roseivirga sp. 4D4]|uniref:sodium-dependent bicarbonate transport family permease n=1 Tax=Roseivirga sp. 4D4 TaxID=1889784 RepID=UPI0008532561|nr:sodium-dependent bicarbonate transport family permease [Roseivirga sp. 4D4]OEK00503.1 sodium-dependent bicarbonate transport family permease [Roseivirga sp. 4D4]
MNLDLLAENLTNPALLFFILGILSVQLKSDLEIPKTSSKFISLYLLFAIGFKGGQELAHSTFNSDIIWSVVFGIFIAVMIPCIAFFILKRRLTVENSGAIAAAYGSVSAVTFVTAVAFLEMQGIDFGGHMVAVMAFMEAPAIVIGVILIRLFSKGTTESTSIGKLVKHAFTNGSVILILGSLAIGWMASEEQAQGIAPFTTDLFKGFLAIFLLDMGIESGKKLKSFLDQGWFTTSFAIIFALFNGCVIALISGFIMDDIGNRFIFAILGASASYIAVPAAMKIAVPQANPGIYIPMALAITFPVNITLGLPIYMYLIQIT